MRNPQAKTVRAIRATVALAVIAAALIVGCAKPPDSPESMVVSAKSYLAKNDRAAAVIQLRRALQTNPNLAEARFLLGSTLLDNSEYAAAEKELRKARDLGYSRSAIDPLLARMLVARGDYIAATKEFANTEVRGAAATAELQTALGRAYLGQNKISEARDRFAGALVQQPDYPPALMGQARAAAIEGDLATALTMVETVLAKSPTLDEAWQLKGDLLSAQGQTEAAAVAYRKALEVKPDYLPAHFALVSLFIQQGKLDAAGEQLERVKKLAPQHPQTLYSEALLAFRQNNLVAAREAIQRQLARSPDDVPGLVLAGRIYNQLDSYAQAEIDLLRVLHSFPDVQAARMILTDTYIRMGQTTKALDTLKPLLETGNSGSDVLELAGQLYARNGESGKAARYFEMAAALDPKSVTKRTAVALSHVAKGEDERGLSELETAAAADPGVRADLAMIATLARRGKFDAALNAIAALEKKQPNAAFTHTMRGEILVGKRDLPGARASFERALSIDPTNFPATAHLAQMDLSEGKPEEAKKRFDAVLAKDPKNVNALLALAGLRVTTGGTTEEVALMLRAATHAAPNDPAPWLALIAHFLTAGQPRNAVAVGQEALAAFPGRPEILDALGRAQQAAGDINSAIATYIRVAPLVPESPMPFVRMAELQVLANDDEGARESVRQALVIAPDLIEAQRILVPLEVRAGATQAAIALARDIQKQHPKEAVGYMLEGDIEAQKKAWSEAAASYRNGLKLAATADLAIRLTTALRSGGSNAEADRFSTSWLKEHPEDRVFLNYMAESAMERKDYAVAARRYKTMLQKQPNDAAALNNLAWVSHQLKDPKALDYAEKANELAPDNAAILDTLSEVLLDQGEVKRAVELQQKALALAPDNAGIRLNFAKALIKDGQNEPAKKQLAILEKLGAKYADQETVARLKQGL